MCVPVGFLLCVAVCVPVCVAVCVTDACYCVCASVPDKARARD